MKKLVARPELGLLLLVLIAFGVASAKSSSFLDLRYLLDTSTLYVEIGLMAVGVTLIIISGEIDLSIASMLTLVGCVVAKMGASPGAMLFGLVLGALLGLFNGFLVSVLRLPSFVVTLGSMALFRGIAEIVVNTESVFIPPSAAGIDRYKLAHIPVPLLILILVAVLVALVLHKTCFGRWIYAIGSNEQAAVYSGVPVMRTKLLLFMISGVMSAIGALLLISRLGLARYDHAQGYELDSITVVVLGGTSIFGGRGTITGTMLALILVGLIRTGMGLANVTAEKQMAIIGTILVLAVIVSNLLQRFTAVSQESKQPATN